MLELHRFYESPRYYGVVTNQGEVYRICRASRKEIPCAIYLHKGKAETSIGGKKFIVKHVMAAAFLPGYYKGQAVRCLDGNELNLRIDNLCAYDKNALGKLTGGLATSQAVSVTYPSGQRARFSSVRKAAKALNCSYQTLLDYMAGSVKCSVLDGLTVTKVKGGALWK